MTPAFYSQVSIAISKAISTAEKLLETARRPWNAQLLELETAVADRNKELSAASQLIDRTRDTRERRHKILKLAQLGPQQLRQLAEESCIQAEQEHAKAVVNFRECGQLWRRAQERLNEALTPLMDYRELVWQLYEIQNDLATNQLRLSAPTKGPTIVDQKDNYEVPNSAR